MENAFYQEMKHLIYLDKIKELYNNRAKEIEYPINLDEIPNVKIIMDFIETRINYYEQTIIINALCYALKNNDGAFINFILLHIDDLISSIYNDTFFLIKMVEYACKNINDGLDSNKKFDPKTNEKVIEEHKKLFDKINNYYLSYQPITKLYRDYILAFLDTIDADRNNKLYYLNTFLKTNYYDSDFIKTTNNVINSENIGKYKYMLVLLILFDCLLAVKDYDKIDIEEIDVDNEEFNDFIKILDIKDIIDKVKNQISNSSDDIGIIYIDNSEIDDKQRIYEYIQDCYDNNVFTLPTDSNLRKVLLKQFIDYNLDDNDRTYDIHSLEYNDKGKILKKIIPFYKLDLL